MSRGWNDERGGRRRWIKGISVRLHVFGIAVEVVVVDEEAERRVEKDPVPKAAFQVPHRPCTLQIT